MLFSQFFLQFIKNIMQDVFNNIKHRENVDSSELTTIKTSVTLKNVFYPKNEKELIYLFDYFSINNLPFKIIGNGSNILLTERACNVNIISTKLLECKMRVQGSSIIAPCSIMLSRLYRYCQEKGLAGFEKLAGIPGTLGGALFMNAGAFGCNITDHLTKVKIYSKGKVKWVKKEKLDIHYRESPFKDTLILSAKFNLYEIDRCEIEREYRKYLTIRLNHQPKGYSFGSTFKNTENYYAGELIDKCGLKGLSCGGAKVSEKHANFIINYNKASVNDVLQLIKIIKDKVFQRYNVQLETEVEIF